MKNLIIFLLIINTLLSCKENIKQHANTEELEIENLEIKEEIILNDTITTCISKRKDFKLFDKLKKDRKIDILDISGSQFYYASRKNDVYSLFNGENIKCVSSASSGKYSFFKIFYRKDLESFEVFSKINKLEETDRNYDKYHGYFKRGIVFSLDSKENTITLVTFNVFADNSLPKKVRTFFKQNENAFEKVFMTTGIGTVEILVE
ncbi:hypothetical protein [Cellulophaga sp. L1A9]|uniref:hypothetical protein n=1 Tax=Cellulophaga sp. L1A9 TaxID=2686362 RepID=UPI00131D7056|nr:hypothetical protein [Cellulophaga sp. L1A9]